MPYIGQQSPDGNYVFDGTSWQVGPGVDLGFGVGQDNPNAGQNANVVAQQSIAQSGRAGLYAPSDYRYAAGAQNPVAPVSSAPGGVRNPVADQLPQHDAMRRPGGIGPGPSMEPVAQPHWATGDWNDTRRSIEPIYYGGGGYGQNWARSPYPRQPGYPSGGYGGYDISNGRRPGQPWWDGNTWGSEVGYRNPYGPGVPGYDSDPRYDETALRNEYHQGAPAQQPQTQQVPYPWQVHPGAWGGLGPVGQGLARGAAGQAGYDANDYEYRMRQSWPSGEAPRAVNYSYARPRSAYPSSFGMGSRF